MSAQSALGDIQTEIERIEKEIENLSQSAPEKVLDFSEAFKQSKSIFFAGGAVASLGLGVALANNQDTKESATRFYFFGPAPASQPWRKPMAASNKAAANLKKSQQISRA